MTVYTDGKTFFHKCTADDAPDGREYFSAFYQLIDDSICCFYYGRSCTFIMPIYMALGNFIKNDYAFFLTETGSSMIASLENLNKEKYRPIEI